MLALFTVAFGLTASCRTARTPAASTARGAGAMMTSTAGIGKMGDTEWRPEGAHGTGYRFMPLDTVPNEPGPMLVRLSAPLRLGGRARCVSADPPPSRPTASRSIPPLPLPTGGHCWRVPGSDGRGPASPRRAAPRRAGSLELPPPHLRGRPRGFRLPSRLGAHSGSTEHRGCGRQQRIPGRGTGRRAAPRVHRAH
eukprot:scaffold25146_cov109-Isochrysis_galbana.AAC.2